MDGASGRIQGRDANAGYANIIRSFHRRYLKRTTLFSPAGIRQKVIPLKAATDAPGPNRTCPAPDALFAVVRVALTIAVFGGFLGATSQGRAEQPFESVGVTYGQAKVIPGEFNGHLSLLPLAPTTLGNPKTHRPRLPGPPPTKFQSPLAAPSAPQAIAGPSAPMPSP